MNIVCDGTCWAHHYETECTVEKITHHGVTVASGCKAAMDNGDYILRPRSVRLDVDRETMTKTSKSLLKSEAYERNVPCASVDEIPDLQGSVYILDSGASADTYDETEARESLASLVRKLGAPLKSSTANGNS